MTTSGSSTAAEQGAALAGLRVLEIGHYIAAPHCTMMLADQGADVIKLEPPEGEPARAAPPFSPHGDSYYYACHNRGKRSVALDLRSPEAREPLDALLRWADVVVTNYSAGVPEKLGFGYERLAQVNSRAVMVHITGYGAVGSRKDYVAFDGAVQAMSGFADLTGAPEGPPLMSQVLVADHAAGTHAAYAVMCAVWEQRRTGRGRKVELSMLATMTSLLSHHIPSKGALGLAPTRQGARSTTRFVDMFQTQDAPVYLAPITPVMWRAFCDLLGRPDWGDNVNPLADPVRKAQVMETAGRWFSQRTSGQALADLQGRRIACGVVRSVSQLYEEEVALGSGVVSHVELARGGPLAPVPGPAFRMGPEPERQPRVAAVGEHTASVFAELGLVVVETAEDLRHA
ncbi:MAG: CoA transferase [Phenylobacterium sp.]|uniref:CaiB/BaiF CoA transferase family protein n=1 Tax=Phenylobacterium sp. TaxID=1871053 RepID=UPI002734A31D|nr:CoA transferase [Phenylobacterium sp.]MDP3747378.1 CoA transferase [Phenylobacterium sp.]